MTARRSPVRELRRAGDRAFLIGLTENREVHRLAAAVRAHFGAAVEDVVPGEETLLISWRDRPPTRPELAAVLAALVLAPLPAPAAAAAAVVIPVHYDGGDLDAVARATGLDVQEVIERHSSPEYVVAFMGFAPGFAYMTGVDPRLVLPRREDPRPRVAAGSVALASTYTAIYPMSAPGGWHLIGHADAVLFDPDRLPPALLAPGVRVAFEVV